MTLLVERGLLARPGWSGRLTRWGALALLGGGIALGQAPWSLWPLALLAWAAAIWALAQARSVFAVTMLLFTAQFAIALHWLVEPFLIDPVATGWLAPIALGLAAVGLSVFPATGAAFAARLAPGGAWRAIAIGAGIALGELARSWVLTGFPWALPGHILLESAALPAASLAGAHGLSLVVLLGAALVATLRPHQGGLGLALWCAPFCYALTLPPAPVAQADAPVLRLVQPNAPQHLKWDPKHAPTFWQRGLELTAAPGDIDAVVWPETALPALLSRSEALREMIARASDGVPAAIGAQRFGPEGNPRNTMALLTGPTGEVALTYDKHHLVPFGEYLPLPALFSAVGMGPLAAQLAGTYASGEGPVSFELPGVGTAMPLICYEAIFPQYLWEVPRPEVLLHLTNDAWFGDFAGPRQHLALARLRAAESGLPLLRAANTGITAAIDARGAVLQSLSLGEAGYLDAPLPPALNATPYAKTGDLPVLLTLLALLGAFAAIRTRQRH